MPRIRRWHPVSHDLNRDTEVRELRKRFGDWMALVWLEMLSIADRNEGVIPGAPEDLAELFRTITISKRYSWAQDQVFSSFTYMADCGWIKCEKDRIVVLKSPKYHPSWEHNAEHEKSQAGFYSLLVSKGVKESKEVSTEDKNKRGQENGINWFEKFWAAYPRRVAKLAAKKAWDRIKPNSDLAESIVKAVEAQKSGDQWRRGYIPNPATWLNQGRWQDETDSMESGGDKYARAARRLEEKKKHESESAGRDKKS